jgi:NADH-quinone oxidoreductase subunit E
MKNMSIFLSPFNKNKEHNTCNEPTGEPSCLWCNLCLEVCEEGLWPALLLEYAKAGQYSECQKLGIDYCTDCDYCTYECPVGIPLYKYLRVGRVLSLYLGNKSGLVPVLTEIQSNFGYLPADMMQHVADSLCVTLGHVFSVASFYKKLRLSPPGRQHIRVCQGTACHIRGAPHVLRQIEQATGIKEGGTSADNEYTLDTVACIGCCSLAPCLTVNNKVHGKLDDAELDRLFKDRGNKNRSDK